MAALQLTIGQRLGPYEILTRVGAGGMGEVYKARDTRLDRIVAIKILPSADPDARARFEREAKAIAALTHPHICRLYDIGHEAGTDYLVMEFVDGETLSARVHRGPLTASDALTTAIEIVDGLECAHRAGIVHRDLKPANIMLTKSGVKLLDFGLAKLHPSPVGVEPFDAAPTIASTSLTAQGTLIGTLPYMAPEQLERGEADPRTDIWAFGCVLSEMLTGKPAFAGPGSASLVGSIMRDDPAPPVLPDANGPALVRVIRGCLAKARDERFQSVHDVRLFLELIAAGEVAGPAAQNRSHPRRVFVLAAVTVAIAAAVAIGLLLERGARSDVADGPLSVSIVAVSPSRVASSPVPLALSPDGRALTYVAADTSGIPHLWYRSLEDGTTRMLPATEGTSQPFFSPDGSKVGFFADGVLKTINVNGGTPHTLAPAEAPVGGTWGPDDTILFCPSPPDGILAVSAGGGTARRIIGNDPRSDPSIPFRLFGGPVFLPDGRHFLYRTSIPQLQPAKLIDPAISVASLDGRQTRQLLTLGSNVAYTAPGFLLYMRDDALVAQEFDGSSLTVRGEPRLIAERIATAGFSGAFATSMNGRIVYVSAASNKVDAEWRDRAGRPVSTVKFEREFSSPALSPDQHWLAGQAFDPATRSVQVLSYDLRRGTALLLTEGPSNTSPVWSSDGSRVLYAALRTGLRVIEAQTINGTTRPETIASCGTSVVMPESVTADGRFLSFRRMDPRTQADIWILPLTGDRTPTPIVNTTAAELQSRFAPNGKWIAYSSNESGRWQVYLQPFPVNGQKYPVSNDGGADPQWRSDSRELFYIRPDRTLMAIAVMPDGKPTLSAPSPLFVTPVVDLVSERNHYVVSPDGQRFLFTGATTIDSAASAITLLVNWPARFVR